MISPLPTSVGLHTTPNGAFGAPRWNPSSAHPPASDPHKPPDRPHEGRDYAAPAGTPVLAVRDGVVLPANAGVGGRVVKVKLDGPDALYQVLADLGTVSVADGQRVAAGDVLGAVGEGGFVHVAFRRGGAFAPFVDPAELFKGAA